MAKKKKIAPKKKSVHKPKKKTARKPKPNVQPKAVERKHPGGRPTKYKSEYCEQVEKLCKLGATDKEIAEFFEVSEDTIHEWKHVHKEFSESLKAGKALADANIAERLYQKAMGFEHDSEEIKVVSDGQGEGSSIVRVPVRKIYPPDTTAAIFWLKNRQKDKWRDKTEQDITSKGESINKPMSDDQFNQIVNMLNGTESGKGDRVEKAS